MADTIYVIDFFSGAGGFSTGVTRAGHKVILCFEYWDVGMAIHAANFPDCTNVMMELGGDPVPFVRDLKTFIERNVPAEAQWHVHFSPPCQSFSIAQRQNKNHDVEKDARSNLTLWVFEVIKLLNPPRFSVEQVPGVTKFLQEHTPWIFKDDSIRVYPKCYGYEFGAPTMRKRLYLGRGWSFDQFTSLYGAKKRKHSPNENSLGLRQVRPDLCNSILHELNSEGTRYDGQPYDDSDVAVKTSANKWVTNKKEREAGLGTNKWVPCHIGQGLRCIDGKPQFATIASYALQLYKRIRNDAADLHPSRTHLNGTWEKFRTMKPSELAAIQSFPASFKIDESELPSLYILRYHKSLQGLLQGSEGIEKRVKISMAGRVRGIGNAVVPEIAAHIFDKLS